MPNRFRISRIANTLSVMDAKPLKPQDLVVLSKLVVEGPASPPIAQLSVALGLSVSEVHAALGRSVAAGLAVKDAKRGVRPHRAALLEFLVHGVRYAFPVSPGTLTRGLPTAGSAEPLRHHLGESSDPPYVWPLPEGSVRGLAIRPLYPSVPRAAQEDPALHELLALVDAMRVGRARDRRLAAKLLEDRLEEKV